MAHHQGSGHIILGAEWVTCTQHQVSPCRLEGQCEVGGFGGNVQAATHPDALQWPFF